MMCVEVRGHRLVHTFPNISVELEEETEVKDIKTVTTVTLRMASLPLHNL